jgi:signal transduction histidine kinase
MRKEYTEIMQLRRPVKQENAMLAVAAFLAWAAVGLGTVFETEPTAVARWVSLALLAAFGVAMARMPERAPPLRAPLLYIGLQSVLAVGLMLIHHDLWNMYTLLLFFLSAHAMLLLPERLAYLVITGYSLVVTGVSLAEWGVPDGLYLLGAYVGGLFAFGSFARALGREVETRRESQRLLAELQEAHRRLQDYAARTEELAVMGERSRLAREMHDTLGHRLTVSAVQLEGAQRLIPADPQRAAGMIETVREQVRDGLQELRRTVATLRAPLEADLQLRGSLRRLALGFEEATGIAVHQALPEEIPPLPSARRVALYRAAQEALTNVQRHSQARQAWLALMVQDEQVVLVVSDDGAGFPAGPIDEGSFGLRGLRERVVRLGGELILESRTGGGAQLRACLPLHGETADG